MATRKRKRVKGSEQRACRGEESIRPARHGPACDAVPRSAEKIDAMCKRASQRQALHSPGDKEDPRGKWYGLWTLLEVATRPGEEYLAEKAREAVLRHDDGSEKDAHLKTTEGHTPGRRIKKSRLAARLTQGALAAAVGLSRCRLNNIESGVKTPSLWSLFRVAETLGHSLDWLACLSRQAGGVSCVCA